MADGYLGGFSQQRAADVNYLSQLDQMRRQQVQLALDQQRQAAQERQFGQEFGLRQQESEARRQAADDQLAMQQAQIQEAAGAANDQSLSQSMRDLSNRSHVSNQDAALMAQQQRQASARNALKDALSGNEDVSIKTLGKAILPYDTSTGIGLLKAAKDEERQNALLERTGGTGVQPEKGYRWTSKGALEAIPGGPADPAVLAQLESLKNKGGSKAASEDERKAAGWLAQATNAYNNMAKVAAEDKSVIAPGMLEAGAESFGLSGTANALRSPKRQQFVQAASSFAEAALRAATGAGVNKDEAKQKIQELTPQYTDAEPVRAQKLESMKVYLDSLSSRAGRAETGFIPERGNIPTGINEQQAPQSAQQKTFNAPPDPRQYEGRTITDPSTGTKLLSRGGQWMRVK